MNINKNKLEKIKKMQLQNVDHTLFCDQESIIYS